MECASPSDPNAPIQVVEGTLRVEHTWTCDKIYVLESLTAVEDGTLRINPGTTIKGKYGSALIINRTAQIHAVGTEKHPIVFTSDRTPGDRASGDWGGLVLLGNAPTNIGVDLPVEGLAISRPHGGRSPEHNCGTLQYIRVEWAGFALAPDKELNGIRFYACGSDTKVDHVQSHMGLDDGIEWFGGGFDANHIVVTAAKDDSLDFDQGFSGKLQFIFIQQAPQLGDNGFEVSRNKNSFKASPTTKPLIANATFIGSGNSGRKGRAFTFKEGTSFGVYNSIAINSSSELFLFQSAETQSFMIADPATAEVRGSILSTSVAGSELARTGRGFGMDPTAVEDWLADKARGNHLRADPGLPSIRWGYPYIKPAAGGLASTGAQPLPAGFAPANYIGAVDPPAEGNWTTESWISYAVQ